MSLKQTLLSSLLLIFSLNIYADLSCQNKKFTWSDTQPSINLQHIFCGESNHGRNKGFHSSALLSSSIEVVAISKKTPLKGGIYSARVKFNQGKNKFSTFFPDHCNVAMIIRSIVYAAKNPVKKHPQWGIIGQSAPKPKREGYCLQTNGNTFMIRMGFMHQGTRVNTAFPQP